MAVWPFKKKHSDNDRTEDRNEDRSTSMSADQVTADYDASTDVVRDDSIGPFDGDAVDVEEFDFSDFASGMLNLGSIKLAMPKTSQVQVEMGDNGPRMLHIVTPHGRITPVAFAAPTLSSQWESSSEEILQGMARDGMEGEFREGAYGREVYGEAGDNAIRIIGIDGPRWMLRLTLASPKEKADELAALAYDIAARTFVYRGSEPMLAGTSLPVAMPQELVQQMKQAMAQRAQHIRAQQAAQQTAQQTQRHDAAAEEDAARALEDAEKRSEDQS